MSIFSSLEHRAHPSNPDAWFINQVSGAETAAGIRVDEDKTLSVPAIFAGVRLLADTIASLPLFVYRRLDRGKDLARRHQLFGLLHSSPNPEMTSFDMRELMQGHIPVWGNAYAEKVFNRRGEVAELWPLTPWRVTPRRNKSSRKLEYEVRIPENAGGGKVILPSERIFHVPGFSTNGVVGHSLADMFSESIGLSLAAESYSGHFFGSGSSPGGVIEHPEKIGETAKKHVKRGWEEAHKGLNRSHRIAILEEGMKWKQTGIDPEKSQLLEARKFQVTEVSRILRVQPHLLMDLERATFTNVEQQSLEFVIYTLRPWLVRWEQRMSLQLFTPQEREEFFPEFVVEGLLRGDIETRFKAYSTARQWGWMSANDVREKENMNPIEGGDDYLIPLNMREIGTTLEADSDEINSVRALVGLEARADTSERRRLRSAFIPVFRDATGRVLRREMKAVRKAVKKFLAGRDARSFIVWLNEFYNQEYPTILTDNIKPVARAYADAVIPAASALIDPEIDPADLDRFLEDYHESFMQREIGSARGQLTSIARNAGRDGVDPAEAVEARLVEWEEKRADKIADWEAGQLANAVASAIFVAGGVTLFRWRAFGKNCPICEGLNGKVVSARGTFVQAGESFQPDGLDTPFIPSHNIGHPPAHGGCDCEILPG